MTTELVIDNETALRQVLAGITFAPSCLDMGWGWEIETLYCGGVAVRGWLVNTTFRRPDTNTGEIGIGSGRKEFIACGSSESAVVKTAWLLAELIVRHELMEAFLYKGVRIFDPHKTVEELSFPARPDGSYERPFRTLMPMARPMEPFVVAGPNVAAMPPDYARGLLTCTRCGRHLTDALPSCISRTCTPAAEESEDG